MMDDKQERRTAAIELIRSNIENSGQHIYVVQQNVVPRFAYTIGLNPRIGAEIVFAGAAYYMQEEVVHVVNEIASMLRKRPDETLFEINDLGSFSLRRADNSWGSTLMLGGLDYYGETVVQALQIVPDTDHWTIDVPDLTRPWSATSEPIWQWLHSAWQYPVPSDSTAVTDLPALRGKRITEATRWEEDQWEMFSAPGPNFPENDIRVVPLATLLAVDNTLVAVTELSVGEGLLRDGIESGWREW